MWLDVKVSEPVQITNDMKKRFRDYWTVEYENYPVTKHYIEASKPLTTKADV